MKSIFLFEMLQMVQPLVQMGTVPPEHITKLIAQLEELWEFKELASELRKTIGLMEQQPQGIPQQGEPQPQQPNGQPIQ